jgi:hypothetical protein
MLRGRQSESNNPSFDDSLLDDLIRLILPRRLHLKKGPAEVKRVPKTDALRRL